jgi:histone deacetylase 11
MRLVYSPRYDLSLPLIDRFHPFDGRKYSRAWHKLESRYGQLVDSLTASPGEPIPEARLRLVHTPQYLASLHHSATIAHALEIPILRFLPRRLLQTRLLDPMRWAAAGTCLAASLAREHRIIFQLGGGFHHAFADHGEGFCLFADAAVAIQSVRHPGDHILIIDLDAHRGNGVAAIFEQDDHVHIFDAFNFQVYPGLPQGNIKDYPFLIPFPSGTGDRRYLDALHTELPRFLDLHPDARLAIYNAGTDIVQGDRLGRLDVSPAGVLQRDQFVIRSLLDRAIPCAMLTSGGYTDVSHELIFRTSAYLIETFASSAMPA